MKPLVVALAIVLSSAPAFAATAGPAAVAGPPLFPWTLDYLHEHGYRDGCVTLRVRAHAADATPAPTEIVVHRSSGDAAFDALVVSDLKREIDSIGRFPIDRYPADASGWRTLPLKLSIKPDHRHKQVLGCAAAAAE